MAAIRDSESTRQHILAVSAEEMRENGYKAASLANILAKAGVSKGALYHHFANKQELGYAVFEEVYVKDFLENWSIPVEQQDPIDGICKWLLAFVEKASVEELEQGCPVCNIALEMSGIDDGFRMKTVAMYEVLGERISRVLIAGQEVNQVKAEINPDSVARFIVAAIQGAMIQGKYARNLEYVKSIVLSLTEYLNMLRA